MWAAVATTTASDPLKMSYSFTSVYSNFGCVLVHSGSNTFNVPSWATFDETVKFLSRWDFTDASRVSLSHSPVSETLLMLTTATAAFLSTQTLCIRIIQRNRYDAMTWVHGHYDSISVFRYNVDHRYLNLRTLCYSTFRTFKRKRKKIPNNNNKRKNKIELKNGENVSAFASWID